MDTADTTTATGTVRMRLRHGGPLVIEGPVRLLAEDGRLLREAPSMALCRCGASREPPYCDGSHRTTAFRDD